MFRFFSAQLYNIPSFWGTCHEGCQGRKEGQGGRGPFLTLLSTWGWVRDCVCVCDFPDSAVSVSRFHVRDSGTWAPSVLFLPFILPYFYDWSFLGLLTEYLFYFGHLSWFFNKYKLSIKFSFNCVQEFFYILILLPFITEWFIILYFYSFLYKVLLLYRSGAFLPARVKVAAELCLLPNLAPEDSLFFPSCYGNQCPPSLLVSWLCPFEWKASKAELSLSHVPSFSH